MKAPVDQLKEAVCRDDVAGVRKIFQEHPELKALVNEPVASFDSQLITTARSKGMVDALLEAGADINAKSRWWAGGFGILHNAPPDVAAYANERGAVADIHAAARLGMVERLEELLGADSSLVHARGGDGQTPLHFAASVQIASRLLDRGAEIDARDVDHESTPAQWMIRERQEVAQFLVERGCKTDLLMASALGHLERARQHLEADPECIRMSVTEKYFPKKNPRSGGTIYIWTLGHHKTAHQVAREFGHPKVLALLLERSPDDLKLAVACELGDEALFRELLARQPDLPRSPGVASRLVSAAQNNNLDAVRLMLDAGWPIEARGQHNGTALHWAAFHGNQAMAELLLTKNPPLELRDSDFGGTPMTWAVHGSEHGWYAATGNYAGVVEALIRAGAVAPARAGSAAVKAVLERAKARS